MPKSYIPENTTIQQLESELSKLKGFKENQAVDNPYKPGTTVAVKNLKAVIRNRIGKIMQETQPPEYKTPYPTPEKKRDVGSIRSMEKKQREVKELPKSTYEELMAEQKVPPESEMKRAAISKMRDLIAEYVGEEEANRMVREGKELDYENLPKRIIKKIGKSRVDALKAKIRALKKREDDNRKNITDKYTRPDKKVDKEKIIQELEKKGIRAKKRAIQEEIKTKKIQLDAEDVYKRMSLRELQSLPRKEKDDYPIIEKLIKEKLDEARDELKKEEAKRIEKEREVKKLEEQKIVQDLYYEPTQALLSYQENRTEIPKTYGNRLIENPLSLLTNYNSDYSFDTVIGQNYNAIERARLNSASPYKQTYQQLPIQDIKRVESGLRKENQQTVYLNQSGYKRVNERFQSYDPNNRGSWQVENTDPPSSWNNANFLDTFIGSGRQKFEAQMV